MCGAAMANARSPNLLRVRGTYRSPLSAVSNEARDGRSATGLIRSAMYCGACPPSALWTSRHSLKSILSAIGSQCNSSNAGVTWSHCHSLGPFVLLHGGHAATNLVWSVVCLLVVNLSTPVYCCCCDVCGIVLVALNVKGWCTHCWCVALHPSRHCTWPGSCQPWHYCLPYWQGLLSYY